MGIRIQSQAYCTLVIVITSFNVHVILILECADEAPTMSPKMLAKQLNIGNPATLERRIRKELEEQGKF